MKQKSGGKTGVARTYHKRSARYDATVKFFNLFRSFGFDIPAWRLAAVQALDLKPADTVIDIGCGTGLNFPILQDVIHPEGKIIGVDISNAMLEQAHRRTLDNSWQNVELVCEDATQYQFPTAVDGIISTFALVLVPNSGYVVTNGCKALRPGKHISILDMAWPIGWSLRWRHLFFFLRSYGVTRKTLESQSWAAVRKTMHTYLRDVNWKRFWFGFFYLATGTR